MIEVIPAADFSPEDLQAHLRHLADNLRQSDLDELRAVSEASPEVALTASVWGSDLCWLVFHHGVPVCAFGAAPTPLPGAGSVWMMGTDGMDGAALSILRRTRPYLAELHKRFPLLWNDIDARNQRSMDWLSWSGFRLLEALPNHGREGRLFFTFARYEPHV